MAERTTKADPQETEPSIQQRLKNAEHHYEVLRSFYQGETIRYSRLYTTLQVLSLAGSALTPLLLLVGLPEKSEYAKLYQALPSAVAGLAIAINSTFRYRQEWVQSYTTLSALTNEFQRFRCRVAPEYNQGEGEAISAFQNKMSDFVMAEVTAWKVGLSSDDIHKTRPDSLSPTNKPTKTKSLVEAVKTDVHPANPEERGLMP